MGEKHHHKHPEGLEPPYTCKDLGLPEGSIYYIEISPQLVMHDRTHYQRYVVEENVLAKLNDKELDKHICLVAKRGDYYFSLDGQHHILAAMRKNISVIGCWCVDTKSWQEEQDIFNKFALWKRSVVVGR